MVAKKETAIKAPAKTGVPVADKPRLSKPHEIVLSSNSQNAVGILSWSKFAGEADLNELCNDLAKETVSVVQDGNMRPIEAMLYQQAKTLETMFTSLARRAANNDGLKQFQCNLTLALKAQAQCRATLEALAEIKNPRHVSFVKQANMTTGPQQVNNGSSHAGSHSHVEKAEVEQNKLLEADHGQWVDIGAQGQADQGNTNMATVESVHRA